MCSPHSLPLNLAMFPCHGCARKGADGAPESDSRLFAAGAFRDFFLAGASDDGGGKPTLPLSLPTQFAIRHRTAKYTMVRCATSRNDCVFAVRGSSPPVSVFCTPACCSVS